MSCSHSFLHECSERLSQSFKYRFLGLFQGQRFMNGGEFSAVRIDHSESRAR